MHLLETFHLLTDIRSKFAKRPDLSEEETFDSVLSDALKNLHRARVHAMAGQDSDTAQALEVAGDNIKKAQGLMKTSGGSRILTSAGS